MAELVYLSVNQVLNLTLAMYLSSKLVPSLPWIVLKLKEVIQIDNVGNPLKITNFEFELLKLAIILPCYPITS